MCVVISGKASLRPGAGLWEEACRTPQHTHMCINAHTCTHTHTHKHALISKTLTNCWLQIYSFWSLYKFSDTLKNLIKIACNNTTDTMIGKRMCCFCSLWDVSVIFIFLLYRIPCDPVSCDSNQLQCLQRWKKSSALFLLNDWLKFWNFW